ncbi:conserved repeat domain protein [[Leptolyngbya] sp. PCC 7376]|uniref:DUF11 domain-containing protein n=1 Tax=[Leptolyngbya] sp. PCC 7376 TaxID=111781 RepID=UPI00029ECB65|nr:DUF11 domain-containing protein [[Leptolyngbya] sp. PCC 7376]AFY37220.1 conserved repeat domain protein [[Leptolyngbya] sp. PCC 7376]
MKRWPLAVGAALALLGAPLLVGSPVLANLQQAGSSLLAALEGADVQLNLVAEKQIITLNAEGEEVITWEDLGANAEVLPGETLRYTVSGDNLGNQDADNLVISQDIPEQMVYVLASAQTVNSATITYSIDDGQTFVANPTIKVQQPDGSLLEQPAPADMYTDVKWEFDNTLTPQLGVEASYEVQIP